MKLFVYNMREFDELRFFENYCKENRIKFEYTAESPTLENAKLAKGCEIVDIITTPIKINYILIFITYIFLQIIIFRIIIIKINFIKV